MKETFLAVLKAVRSGMWLSAALLAFASWSIAQTQSQQQIPDAPSAKRTPQQLPSQPTINTAPLPDEDSTDSGGSSSSKSSDQDEKNAAKPATGKAPEKAPEEFPFPESAPTETAPAEIEVPVSPTVPANPHAPPALPPQTAPEEAAGTLKVIVKFVSVPVTVKDNSGRLVEGLLPKDFQLLENGAKQDLKYFTSDPFAISAAIVFDQGMPDVAVRKLNQTFPALEGAFSKYDEVALYTYSSAVRKVKDFGALGKGTTAALNSLKTETGRNSGPPVIGGPFGSEPSVNGRAVGGGPTRINTVPQESHVLNDALLKAALDLSRRERGRRKILFIVSDGREKGSEAAYSDVLRFLLTNEITVYAVAVDAGSLPGIRKIEQLKLPRQGYSNILPKYANATGGEVFSEFSKEAMEEAYARATGDARDQYTLGYYTHAKPGAFRELEVLVARKGVKVQAKAGFYPMPPPRTPNRPAPQASAPTSPH